MSLTDNHNRAFGMEAGRKRCSIFGARPCVKRWCCEEATAASAIGPLLHVILYCATYVMYCSVSLFYLDTGSDLSPRALNSLKQVSGGFVVSALEAAAF